MKYLSILFSVILILVATPTFSKTQTLTASTVEEHISYPAGSTSGWTNPGNVFSSNDSYASIILDQSQQSRYLVGSSFGFSIPTTAHVNSVIATGEHGWSSGAFIGFSEGNCLVSGEAYDPVNSSYGTGIIESTGVDFINTWGKFYGMSASEVNNSAFGYAVTFTNSEAIENRVLYIDHIYLTVYYVENHSAVMPVVCN